MFIKPPADSQKPTVVMFRVWKASKKVIALFLEDFGDDTKYGCCAAFQEGEWNEEKCEKDDGTFVTSHITTVMSRTRPAHDYDYCNVELELMAEHSYKFEIVKTTAEKHDRIRNGKIYAHKRDERYAKDAEKGLTATQSDSRAKTDALTAIAIGLSGGVLNMRG